MNNCDCNQGRQPCTCKPLPPAGGVQFVGYPPVPEDRKLSPAGDVEVKVFDMKIVMQAIQAVGRLSIPSSNNCHLLSVELNKIVSAHVTRLTAERDGLLAEVKRLESDVSIFQNEYVRHSELEDVQDELTKARELLVVLRKSVVKNSDMVERASLLPQIDAALAHQSAPAAKCSNCGQAEKGQTGEYPCAQCGVPLTHDAPDAKGGSDE